MDYHPNASSSLSELSIQTTEARYKQSSIIYQTNLSRSIEAKRLANLFFLQSSIHPSIHPSQLKTTCQIRNMVQMALAAQTPQHASPPFLNTKMTPNHSRLYHQIHLQAFHQLIPTLSTPRAMILYHQLSNPPPTPSQKSMHNVACPRGVPTV